MKPIWFLVIAFILLLILSITIRSATVRKSIAVIFFLVALITCTLYFEVSVRIVLENAKVSGELSRGFALGVHRLSGWLIWDRIINVLAALGLLIIALRKP